MKKVALICIAVIVPLTAVVYFSVKKDSSKNRRSAIAESVTSQIIENESRLPLAQSSSVRKRISKIDERELTSRYIASSDDQLKIVSGIPVRSTWTTRPAEYAWAVKFTGPDQVVLDAGCGISHPLKWKLAQTCQEAWAIDIDSRISSKEDILSETRSDLGEVAYIAILNNKKLWEKIHLMNENILALSNDFPKFDRIFCISVIDQIPPEQRKEALSNLSSILASGGLILVTFPDAMMDPKQFLADASEVGLVPAGSVDLEKPNENSPVNEIFRCALKKRVE